MLRSQIGHETWNAARQPTELEKLPKRKLGGYEGAMFSI